jgi:hypothetical protein
MSTIEVKNNLHRLIVETDDEAILLQVMSLFSALREEKQISDWGDTISKQEATSIHKGVQQAAQGERIAHSAVRKNNTPLRD